MVVENEGSGECERIVLAPEGEVVKKVLGPKLPTQAEVDEHYAMGHTIFRNWCPICVRAYGKEMDHRRVGI